MFVFEKALTAKSRALLPLILSKALLLYAFKICSARASALSASATYPQSLSFINSYSSVFLSKLKSTGVAVASILKVLLGKAPTPIPFLQATIEISPKL